MKNSYFVFLTKFYDLVFLLSVAALAKMRLVFPDELKIIFLPLFFFTIFLSIFCFLIILSFFGNKHQKKLMVTFIGSKMFLLFILFLMEGLRIYLSIKFIESYRKIFRQVIIVILYDFSLIVFTMFTFIEVAMVRKGIFNLNYEEESQIKTTDDLDKEFQLSNI